MGEAAAAAAAPAAAAAATQLSENFHAGASLSRECIVREKGNGAIYPVLNIG